MASSLLWNRIYGDFLMPSRLGSYRRMLESARQADYRVVSIERFWRLLADGADSSTQRYLVLRHDVDTDPRTAGAMWEVDRDLEVQSSYYFRLSTLDVTLMRAIGESGGEASYHYEELATVIKDRHLRYRQDALRHLPEAQDRFRRNLDWLRAMTGLPMRVVASHGDFTNRMLGVPNTAILSDPRFRREVGIDLEAYDGELMRHLACHTADAGHPRYWTHDDPVATFGRGEPVVYVLVHPRHWRVDRGGNARDDLRRIWEGFRYAIPALRSGSTPP